jgi:hypothetical protein
MVEFIAYQDVECVYPMSSQYGRAPRVLYYALLLFVVVLCRQDWLTAGAAAACLTYGGSAAIHAMILATTTSLGRTSISQTAVQLPNATQVAVQALVIDLDSDGTLAIVGAGFLIVVPMAIWSAHFRHSGAVPILVLWIILISTGMLCYITNLYAIDTTASGPLRQFRFCSLASNDTFPISSSSPITIINNSLERHHLVPLQQHRRNFPPTATMHLPLPHRHLPPPPTTRHPNPPLPQTTSTGP